MTRLEFKKLIEEGFVILDGATGSLLQKKGMMPGDCPEQWIIVFIILIWYSINILCSC